MLTMIKRFILSVICFSVATASVVVAQDSVEQSVPRREKPNHTVTFLPMGQAPPFEIKGRGENRVIKAPPKDALPPKGLLLPSKKKAIGVKLKLAQQSKPYKIRLSKSRKIQLGTSLPKKSDGILSYA